MTLNRRDLLAAAAATAGLAGLSPALTVAQDLREINFVTPFGYLIGFSPSLNAQAGGRFAENGLDVTVLPGKGSAVAVQQVLAGRAFYGRGDPLAVVKAAAEGAEVVTFATPLHTSPIVVYSSPDDPINNPSDMEGKTIGIAAPGSASDNLLDMMLASVGLSPDSVRREAIGNSPGGWGLIQQGRVDAHIVSLGTTTTLRESGENIVMWPTRDAVKMPGQAYFALRETVENEPEVLADILRSIRASMLDLREGDKRAMIERMGEQWDIAGIQNLDFTTIALTEEEKLWWRDDPSMLLKNDAESWANMVNLMKQVGQLDAGEPTDFYTNAITGIL